jgi:hypothetical protein
MGSSGCFVSIRALQIAWNHARQSQLRMSKTRRRAHIDENQRSSKCRLLRVARKWLTCGQSNAIDLRRAKTLPL